MLVTGAVSLIIFGVLTLVSKYTLVDGVCPLDQANDLDVGTIGCFSQNFPLVINQGSGWIGSPKQFQDYHLQNKWYGSEIVSNLSGIVGGSKPALTASPSTGFYYFSGGGPISEHYECPIGIVCLMTASFKNDTWSTSNFPLPRKSKIPKRIVESQGGHVPFYFVLVKGPKRGRIFNPLSLAMKKVERDSSFGRYTSHSAETLKYIPLFLDRGVPDGILGFK